MENNENRRILIVDDEFSVRDSLYNWFRDDGYFVDTAENSQEALKKIQNTDFDLALLDIRMPGMDGIELQKKINELYKGMTIIFITAYASVDTAVQALKQGAFDYITKPFDPDELSNLINNAFKQRELTAENIKLKEHIDEICRFDEIVGKSTAINKVFKLIETVAGTESTVMITGDSGTGKELVARAIHLNSPRKYFPMITVNCGAVAEGIMESELFGHEKGAFTGAQYKRKGKFEMADNGTIFFDEIGNISIKMQMEILRVLETKKIMRLGGNKIIDVDFRVVCATNKNLEEEVKKGTYREDLFYRLNVFKIDLPPLRERRADIPLLLNHFIDKHSKSMHKDIKGYAPGVLNAFMQYHWPGNIRELANAIERAMVIGRSKRIELPDLSFQFTRVKDEGTHESLEEIEKDHIIKMLKSTDWNIKRTAQILSIDRVTLYNRIKKYGLRKPS